MELYIEQTLTDLFLQPESETGKPFSFKFDIIFEGAELPSSGNQLNYGLLTTQYGCDLVVELKPKLISDNGYVDVAERMAQAGFTYEKQSGDDESAEYTLIADNPRRFAEMMGINIRKLMSALEEMDNMGDKYEGKILSPRLSNSHNL